nr:hypothetical protein [Pseudomonadota bacterium]
HEYKGAATAQGIALDHLGKAARKTLALTGTLLGGYSSNLFYLLYRLSGDIQGKFKFKEVKRWMELYGVLEKITYISNDEEGRASLKKAQEVRWHEKPGISPALIPELLPKTVFLKLSDLNISLPPYREVVHPIAMEKEHKAAYRAFQEELLGELRAALQRGSRRLLGTYLQALLGYSDSPWVNETIHDGNRVIAESVPLREDRLYPKETELIRICQDARKAGRRTVVYLIHTDTRDLTQRVKKILEENGLRADVLEASKVRPKKREEWIQKNRSDVLLTHPRNVQTGLDLIEFPEVVWYQQDSSVYILRQASRRSWRIGQSKPVNVHYLYYKNSIQEKTIRLNIQKLRTALLTEGDLIDEGLVSQAEEDSLISLAKAIINKSNETVSLESELDKLRSLQGETDTILADNDRPEEPWRDLESTPGHNEPERPTMDDSTPPAALQQELESLRKLRDEKTRQRKHREIQHPNQLVLFSL